MLRVTVHVRGIERGEADRVAVSLFLRGRPATQAHVDDAAARIEARLALVAAETAARASLADEAAGAFVATLARGLVAALTADLTATQQRVRELLLAEQRAQELAAAAAAEELLLAEQRAQELAAAAAAEAPLRYVGRFLCEHCHQRSFDRKRSLTSHKGHCARNPNSRNNRRAL
jgi:hypothetical protein